MLNLASDTKRFPPSKLPPTWVEADRLVKLRREEGHHILSVRDLVAGLGKDSNGGGARLEGAAAAAAAATADVREGPEGWEDARNAVVSTVRRGYTEAVVRCTVRLFVGCTRAKKNISERALYEGGCQRATAVQNKIHVYMKRPLPTVYTQPLCGGRLLQTRCPPSPPADHTCAVFPPAC